MDTRITGTPVAKAQMLVRRPAAEVFEAFVDPAVTTRFWFTRSSGRLEAGRETTWDWEMYDASTTVLAKAIEPHRRIVIEWDGYSGRTTVEWTFTDRGDATTYVEVAESGWTGDGDALLGYVADATQGFVLTLAGLKAWLEHGIELNLVADKDPDAIVPQWRARSPGRGE